MIPSAQLDTKSQELQLVGIFWNIFVDSSLKTPKPYSNGGNFIIDRYIYNKIGGMNEALFISEDHDILRKAYSWGISAKFNKNVKVKLSVRRLEKENGWKLFYKYFIAIVYVFMGKNVDTKKFTYEMGGHAYSSKKKKNVKLSHETYSLFRKQLKSMKLYFKDLLETS
jgi:hypothetical protein